MAVFGGVFDAKQVDPNKAAFEVFEPGSYPVMIVKSEMQPTKDGGGQFLYLELDILDGPHKGKKLFDRLNLVNNGPKKETTEAMAQRTLSQICHAVGVLECTDSEQLHMKPMMAEVVVQPAKGQYEASNAIKKYVGTNGVGAATAANAFVRPGAGAAPAVQPAAQPAANDGAAQAAAAAPQPAAAPAFARPAGGATPPWKTKAA